MSTISNYHRINAAFEKAVILLQENLQYLANSGKVSAKFISMQNNIIRAIIDYQHKTEKILGELEWENLELANGKVKELEQLKRDKKALEAICIIHGITDLPVWFEMSEKHLVHQAISDFKENITTLPYELRLRFEALPKSERDFLDKILYKKYYEEMEELKRKIEFYKQKKNGS